MSGRGVFAVDRGLWDHPFFADEPFTEREAWQWLIAEAAFKKRSRRAGAFVVELERGQVAVSIRFLAEKWGWNRRKVERFLNRLKSGTMVVTATVTGISVITICNYNKFQRISLPRGTAKGTANGTGEGQERDKTEDTKIKVIKEDSAGAQSDPEKAIENYNTMADRLSLAKIAIVTKERQRKLDLRLKEVGLKGWNAALRNMADMPFCYGENDRGWKVNFDWMLNPTNLTKLIEKQYEREEKRT